MVQRRSGRKQAKTGRPSKRGTAKKKPNRKSRRGHKKRQDLAVDDDPQARKFLKKYRDHPALQNDCIYALPFDLIAAILKELPEFLSSKDEEFEFALTESCGSGFFLKQSFQYSLFPTFNAKNRQQQWERPPGRREARCGSCGRQARRARLS